MLMFIVIVDAIGNLSVCVLNFDGIRRRGSKVMSQYFHKHCIVIGTRPHTAEPKVGSCHVDSFYFLS